ncbi:MAG: hypothetical protein AAF127_07590 [Pseudomonadota bacterium]
MTQAPRSRLRLDLLIGVSLRGAGAVSSFALAWLIAQIFGAKTVGLYQLGATTANLFAVIALLGHAMILVREASPKLRDGEFGAVHGIYLAIRRFVLKAGICLAIVAILLAYPLAVYVLDEAEAAPFIIAMAPTIVLIPIIVVQNSLLRCQGSVIASQSLEGVFYTSLVMLALAGLWLAFGNFPPLIAPLAMVVAQAIALGIGYWLVSHHTREWPKQDGSADPRSGARIAAGSVMEAGANWGALLIITALLSASDAGIFRVAFLIAALMQVVNTSFAAMSGPYLARAAEAGHRREYRMIIITTGLIGSALCAPVAGVAVFLPEFTMSLFGEEFLEGAVALQLLALAGLVRVSAGPIGTALIMQNRELYLVGVVAVTSVIFLALTLVLLPIYGITGAAMALLIASVLRVSANWVGSLLLPFPSAKDQADDPVTV